MAPIWVQIRTFVGVRLEKGGPNYFRVRVMSPLLEYHTYYFDNRGSAFGAFDRIRDRLEFLRRQP